MFKDLTSLKHAYGKYGSRLIYIMAKDEDAVVRLVNEAMEGAFHEVRNQLTVIKANQLKKLHEVLGSEAVRKPINTLMRLRLYLSSKMYLRCNAININLCNRINGEL